MSEPSQTSGSVARSAEGISIRPAHAGDRGAWAALWDGYCEFYEQEVPEATTEATWQRILDGDSAVGALVALSEEIVVGFANYVVHPRTWGVVPTCYLEDLFVAPEARGRGAGRALIEGLRTLCAERGWTPLYWHTQAGNERARALYDSFAPADGFVRYSLALDRSGGERLSQ